MPHPDALVIGAGVIGAAVAYYLAKNGGKVIVVEGAGVASGASGAAEGIVGSITKRKTGPVTDMVVASFAMFPGLEDELGAEIEFVRKPGIMVVFDEDHVPLLKRVVERRQGAGLSIEWLDERAVHEAEPLLNDEVIGGVYTPAQGLVNSIRLTHGYLAAAKRLGAEVVTGAAVTNFERSGQRINAVVAGAERIPSGVVINAAGCGAGDVARFADSKFEIEPKRAQMLISEAITPGLLRNTIYCAENITAGLDPNTLEFEDMPADHERREAELLNPWKLSSFTQTVTGQILFCGGFGFVGNKRSVDPDTVMAMVQNVTEVIPAFSDLRIIRAWAGLEPCTLTNLPSIGKAGSCDNFYVAAGHGNAGVMMSPYTGKALADLVCYGTDTPILNELRG